MSDITVGQAGVSEYPHFLFENCGDNNRAMTFEMYTDS